jgi:DNA-binding NarL/FixJ family response regulator
MSSDKTRVLVVDDSDDLAAMLAVVLDAEPDLECSGRLPSADDLAGALAEQKPDVVLMDLTMPGRDPMEAMADASARFPESRFVVLSGYDDPRRVDDAVSRGAWGFVSKHGDIDKLLGAIRAVAGGRVYLSEPN